MKLNIVPPRTGVQWVKDGVRTFFRQPLALAGLFFMFTVAVLLLASIPLIGPLSVVLVPAMTLGMLAATEQAAQGRFPMPSVLLSAFRAGKHRLRAMLVLGAFYAVIMALIVGLMALTAPPPPQGGASGGDAAAAVSVGPLMLLILFLQVPLLVVFTHAPALVHWHGVGPLQSVFYALVALWRNKGAFLVYGAVWLAFMFVVGIGLSLLIAVFGTTPSPQMIIPAGLLIAAMFYTSLYFTFRDCFLPDTPDDTPPGGAPR